MPHIVLNSHISLDRNRRQHSICSQSDRRTYDGNAIVHCCCCKKVSSNTKLCWSEQTVFMKAANRIINIKSDKFLLWNLWNEWRDMKANDNLDENNHKNVMWTVFIQSQKNNKK